MKQYSTAILIFFQIMTLHAQNRHENNWVFGFNNLGGNLLNFDNDSVHIEPINLTEANTYEALACMSDKAGNLLFYTNNCTVFNKNHQVMENGEGLNPGQIQTYWCSVNPFANPNANSALILPTPDNDQIFHIFHWDFEVFNFGLPGGSQFAPLHFYHTIVDMSENNGAGKVISKNNLIIEDTLSSCAIQAVRHANGRDWWILIPEFKSNCYYTVLLNPIKIEVVNKQCIGHLWDKYDQTGGAQFVSDGSKYVRSHAEYGLNVFDFDRCTGELSNPIHIDLESAGTYLISSLALSPSGRFAYYNTLQKIYQFDLEAQDISASKTLVAQYDGFINFGAKTDFYFSKLAPDGKIYMCTFDPTYYLHVIEYPDSAGLACTVRQHSVELPNRHFAAMPNYPNYRLGVLAGSPCDTITTSTTNWERANNELLVYPNPSTGDLQITSARDEDISLVELFDVAGKLVYTRKVHQSTVHLDKNEHLLEKGFYLLRTTAKSGRTFLNKIIME